MASALVIDAVITWVDGDDPVLAAKRHAYLGSSAAHREASRSTRFSSVGEIEYCIASILRFAPFIRRIFVVTDAQVPAVIKQGLQNRAPWADKIEIVDHLEIFAGYEQYLPTFSSCSIETMLHRTPGLSEHFISFNDDFILMRQVQPSDFFIAGNPVLRGRWRRQRLERDIARILKQRYPLLPIESDFDKPTFRLAQARAANLAGWKLRYFHADHVPRPLRRSTLEKVFEHHPAWLHHNISHRLRDVTQFFALALANHLEIKAGTAAIERHLAMLYVEPAAISTEELKKALTAASADERLLFVCLQSLDEASTDKQLFVSTWLDSVIGRLQT